MKKRLLSIGELDDLRQALNIAEQNIQRGLRVIEQIAEIEHDVVVKIPPKRSYDVRLNIEEVISKRKKKVKNGNTNKGFLG